MRHLYVAATLFELRSVFEFVPESLGVGELFVFGDDGYLVCGVGQMHAAMNLSSVLYEVPPLGVIHLGIAGAYPNSGLEVGDCVWIQLDSLADLGISDGVDFKSPRDLGWKTSFEYEYLSPVEFPYLEGDFTGLRRVKKSATVNRCTGSIVEANFFESLGFETETMEGAAVAAVAQKWNIPAVQIRAISNIATQRDERAWDIPGALLLLRSFFARFAHKTFSNPRKMF